jgi:hypothetical protein
MLENKFKEDLNRFFLSPSEVQWANDIPKFDLEMQLQAGIYIKDHYNEAGYSGGALVKLENGVFFAHAKTSWNAFDQDDEIPAVLAVPVQQSERKLHAGFNVEADLGIPVMIRFKGFYVNDKKVRFASFVVFGVAPDFLSVLPALEDILIERKKIQDILPMHSELGKD